MFYEELREAVEVCWDTYLKLGRWWEFGGMRDRVLTHLVVVCREARRAVKGRPAQMEWVAKHVDKQWRKDGRAAVLACIAGELKLAGRAG